MELSTVGAAIAWLTHAVVVLMVFVPVGLIAYVLFRTWRAGVEQRERLEHDELRRMRELRDRAAE